MRSLGINRKMLFSYEREEAVTAILLCLFQYYTHVILYEKYYFLFQDVSSI